MEERCPLAKEGSNSSDDSDLEEFAAVLAALDRVQLILLMKNLVAVHENRAENVDLKISIGDPMFGSYHVVLPLLLDGNPRWVVKIPQNGTTEHWDENLEAELISEVGTMKLLKRETSVPVPDVIEFSATTRNRLCCPFIVMSYVHGQSLYDVWFGHHLRGVSIDLVREHRMRALRDIASAMVQLGQFRFSHGGRPLYDTDHNLVGIGSFRVWDRRDSFPLDVIYVTIGPWAKPSAYYMSRVDWYPNTSPDSEPVLRGEVELMRFLLNAIPEPNERNPFVLSHPDFNFQNMIVSDDGALQSIIDWSGVIAVPRTCGNESYPLWLIRDWYPNVYVYDESMDRGVEPEGFWEDSPEDLRYYRNEYRKMITELLSETRCSFKTSFTGMSIVTVNLSLAVHGGIASWLTLEKIVKEMRALHECSGIPKEFVDLLALMGSGNVPKSLMKEMRVLFERLMKQ